MNNSNKGLTAFLGMAFGAAGGWLLGYFIIITRCTMRAEELGPSLGTSLGEAYCMAMAPKAPDTILIAAFGAVLGLLIGGAIATKRESEHEQEIA